MKKNSILILVYAVLVLTGCKNDEKVEMVNTTNIIKPDASYGDDMVTMSGYDFQTGYSTISIYNTKTDNVVVACGLGNCTHQYSGEDAIKCNALYEGKISYPFIYENSLYYIYEGGGNVLYGSNVDGSDKRKICDIEFEIDNMDAIMIEGKLYITSSSTETGKYDEDGVSMTAAQTSELYEIDIKTGSKKQLTNFGKKASVLCHTKIKKGNKIYLGITYKNKNIYDSKFKSWSKYMEWLTSCKNPYKEEREIFDGHADYYSVDICDGTVEKLEFNYDMEYDEMENVKGYYDFRMIAINDDYCYFTTNYGNEYSLYEYNLKSRLCNKIDSAYRMTAAYNDGKIYIGKTQFDESKIIGADSAEDVNVPPVYRCYDTKKREWRNLEFSRNIDKKLLRIEAASGEYIFGYLVDFTDEDSSDEIEFFSLGEMVGLKTK